MGVQGSYMEAGPLPNHIELVLPKVCCNRSAAFSSTSFSKLHHTLCVLHGGSQKPPVDVCKLCRWGEHLQQPSSLWPQVFLYGGSSLEELPKCSL